MGPNGRGLHSSHDASVNGGFEPGGAIGLGGGEGGPFVANELDADRVAVGGQQGLDVNLVLGSEGDHLGEDDAFGGGDADLVALGPVDLEALVRIRE